MGSHCNPRSAILAFVVLLALVSSAGIAMGSSAGVGALAGGAGRVDRTEGGPRGTCTKGVVSRGQRPGAIDFEVFCQAPPAGGEVRFALQRYSFKHPRSELSIGAFRRRPPLSGAGVVSRHGVCRKGRSVLGCSGRADGQVRFSGRIWVRKAGVCAYGVTLTVAKQPRCGDEACVGPFEVRTLTHGRPRGC